MIDTIKSLINIARRTQDKYSATLEYKSYLSEHRSISIQVPRRSGKTTAAIALYKETSSLLIVPNESFKRSVPGATSIHNLPLFRGTRFNGMKYQYMILDDAQPTKEFYDFLADLAIHDALTKDFLIIRLYT